MLNQVILQSSSPMTLDIDGVDPEEILVLKGVSGLTPADVNLFTGEYARNGGYYQGRRVPARFPVFTFKLNPNYAADIDVSDIRQLLIRQFYEPQASSDGLQVTLKDSKLPDTYFICYAEKWQGEIFSDNTDVQIPTVCVDPFLRSVAQTSATNATGWVSTPVTYDGTADVGFEASLLVKTAGPQVVLDLNGTKMTIVTPVAVNDVIYINTNEGARAIKKNGVDIMAAYTTPGWLMFSQKNNTLQAYGSVAGDGKVVITNYKFRSAWWGI